MSAPPAEEGYHRKPVDDALLEWDSAPPEDLPEEGEAPAAPPAAPRQEIPAWQPPAAAPEPLPAWDDDKTLEWVPTGFVPPSTTADPLPAVDPEHLLAWEAPQFSSAASAAEATGTPDWGTGESLSWAAAPAPEEEAPAAPVSAAASSLDDLAWDAPAPASAGAEDLSWDAPAVDETAAAPVSAAASLDDFAWEAPAPASAGAEELSWDAPAPLEAEPFAMEPLPQEEQAAPSWDAPPLALALESDTPPVGAGVAPPEAEEWASAAPTAPAAVDHDWEEPPAAPEPPPRTLRDVHLEGAARLVEKLKIARLPTVELLVQEESQGFTTTLPDTLARLRVADSASPGLVHLRVLARPAALLLCLGMFLASLFLAGWGWVLQDEIETTEIQNRQLKSRLQRVKLVVPGAVQQVAANPRDIVKFLLELDQARVMTPFKDVVSEISGALGEEMTMEKLRIEVPGSRYRITLDGRIDTGFNQSQEAWQSFQQKIRQSGYRVVEQKFSTTIDASTFHLVMDRGQP